MSVNVHPLIYNSKEWKKDHWEREIAIIENSKPASAELLHLLTEIDNVLALLPLISLKDLEPLIRRIKIIVPEKYHWFLSEEIIKLLFESYEVRLKPEELFVSQIRALFFGKSRKQLKEVEKNQTTLEDFFVPGGYQVAINSLIAVGVIAQTRKNEIIYQLGEHDKGSIAAWIQACKDKRLFKRNYSIEELAKPICSNFKTTNGPFKISVKSLYGTYKGRKVAAYDYYFSDILYHIKQP